MLDHPGVFECCLFRHILLTKGHVVHLSILWLLKGGKIPDGFQTITTLKGLAWRHLRDVTSRREAVARAVQVGLIERR
jgi:hypothetical protein